MTIVYNKLATKISPLIIPGDEIGAKIFKFKKLLLCVIISKYSANLIITYRINKVKGAL